MPRKKTATSQREGAPRKSKASKRTGRTRQRNERGEILWEVLEVVAQREVTREYLIRWEGSDPATGRPWELTWEPPRMLFTAEEVLETFYKSRDLDMRTELELNAFVGQLEQEALERGEPPPSLKTLTEALKRERERRGLFTPQACSNFALTMSTPDQSDESMEYEPPPAVGNGLTEDVAFPPEPKSPPNPEDPFARQPPAVSSPFSSPIRANVVPVQSPSSELTLDLPSTMEVPSWLSEPFLPAVPLTFPTSQSAADVKPPSLPQPSDPKLERQPSLLLLLESPCRRVRPATKAPPRFAAKADSYPMPVVAAELNVPMFEFDDLIRADAFDSPPRPSRVADSESRSLFGTPFSRSPSFRPESVPPPDAPTHTASAAPPLPPPPMTTTTTMMTTTTARRMEDAPWPEMKDDEDMSDDEVMLYVPPDEGGNQWIKVEDLCD